MFNHILGILLKVRKSPVISFTKWAKYHYNKVSEKIFAFSYILYKNITLMFFLQENLILSLSNYIKP